MHGFAQQQRTANRAAGESVNVITLQALPCGRLGCDVWRYGHLVIGESRPAVADRGGHRAHPVQERIRSRILAPGVRRRQLASATSRETRNDRAGDHTVMPHNCRAVVNAECSSSQVQVCGIRRSGACGWLQFVSRLIPEDDLPVVFHVDHCPAFRLSLIEARVQLADMGLAVIGPFAFAVSMVDIQ